MKLPGPQRCSVCGEFRIEGWSPRAGPGTLDFVTLEPCMHTVCTTCFESGFTSGLAPVCAAGCDTCIGSPLFDMLGTFLSSTNASNSKRGHTTRWVKKMMASLCNPPDAGQGTLLPSEVCNHPNAKPTNPKTTCNPCHRCLLLKLAR